MDEELNVENPEWDGMERCSHGRVVPSPDPSTCPDCGKVVCARRLVVQFTATVGRHYIRVCSDGTDAVQGHLESEDRSILVGDDVDPWDDGIWENTVHGCDREGFDHGMRLAGRQSSNRYSHPEIFGEPVAMRGGAEKRERERQNRTIEGRGMSGNGT